MKNFSSMLFVFAAFIMQSCTQKDINLPVNAATVSVQQQAITANLKSPLPGDYGVKLYIENGDTSTLEFKGYVFTFKANGILLAKFDDKTYSGKWESGNNGKQLKLDIKGTIVLDDVNKNWDVVLITNVQISLKDNQGKFGDKLVFVKN